jgi:hypothetical protein
MILPTAAKAIGQEIYDLLAASIGADTVTFTANIVRAVDVPFTPAIDMPVPHLANGHGFGPITSSGTSLLSSTDPTTGDKVFTLKAPAGGWRWVTSGGGTYSLTIYGWVWLDAVEGLVQAAGLLAAPIIFDADGQSLEVDAVEFRLPPGGLT